MDNNNMFQPASTQNEPSDWKKSVTTVTPLSKYLALALFIILPFAGFWLGLSQSSVVDCITMDSAEEVITETTNEPAQEASTEAPEATTETKTPAAATTQAVTPTYTPAAAGPTELTVFITEATLEYISVDNIGIYKDNTAVKQMIADGLCPASEPQKCRLENGVYYRNTDQSTRIYTLSPNVDIQTWTGTQRPLSQLINEQSEKIPYTITLDSAGYVIAIKEIYRP